MSSPVCSQEIPDGLSLGMCIEHPQYGIKHSPNDPYQWFCSPEEVAKKWILSQPNPDLKFLKYLINKIPGFLSSYALSIPENIINYTGVESLIKLAIKCGLPPRISGPVRVAGLFGQVYLPASLRTGIFALGAFNLIRSTVDLAAIDVPADAFG